MGALVGLDNIDTAKVQKVLECKLDEARAYRVRSSLRPKFIMPGEGCIDLMMEMIRISPQELQMATKFVD